MGTFRSPSEQYDGEWKDNKRNGKGKCAWASGSWYDGEWKDDKCDGHGIYFFVNQGTY